MMSVVPCLSAVVDVDVDVDVDEVCIARILRYLVAQQVGEGADAFSLSQNRSWKLWGKHPPTSH